MIVATKYINYDGIYICHPNIMAASDSDFQNIQVRRIIDKGTRLARQKALPFLQGEAEAEEGGIGSLIAALDTGIGAMKKDNECVDYNIAIALDQDISDGWVRGDVSIQPFSYMDNIALNIGLVKQA